MHLGVLALVTVGELAAAIKELPVRKQEFDLTAKVSHVLANASNTLIAPLSPRQAEILQSIVHGLSNPDIAKQLGISLDMVNEHTEALFQKLGVANRLEAVAIALRKHLQKI